MVAVTWLITSDLHLSDRPRDEYRFGLFAWLAQQQQKYDVTATFVLGDITETKDRHSSSLVNRVVDELTGLRPPVYILRGNHDGIDPGNPFFRFTSCIDGIHFVIEPTYLKAHDVAMIPHCRDQAEFDRACGIVTPKSTVMLHATIDGAIAETGSRLTGLQWPPKGLKGWAGTPLAGDIHRPQRLACGVVYVGSPFQVRFGDDYVPRVLLLKGGRQIDLHFPAPRKWSLTIRDPGDLKRHDRLRQGDQIKLTIELAREEVVQWAEVKQQALDTCKELGLEVYGVELKVAEGRRQKLKLEQTQAKTNEDVFVAYCNHEGIASNIKQAGMELLQ